MDDNTYQKHLFFTNQQSKIYQNRPFGILIGSEGTGKTTLFNQLVNKEQIDQDIKASQPQDFFSTFSANENKFKILDSLGTCGDNTKYMNAFNLNLAMIEGPVNKIFLLIKYERLGLMQKNFCEQMFYLKEDWKNLITIVITNWDREDTPENRKIYQDIIASIADDDFSQQYPFIFVGKQPNKQQLCEAFYNNMCQNEPIKLEIDYSQDLFFLNENQSLFVDKQKQYIQKLFDYYFKKIQKLHQLHQTDKIELLEDFNLKTSQEKMNLINEFLNKYGKQSTYFQVSVYYLEIKKYFIEEFEKNYNQQLQPQKSNNILRLLINFWNYLKQKLLSLC